MLIAHLPRGHAWPCGTSLPHMCLVVLNMATAAAADHTAFEIISFVRRFHAYKDIWRPRVGEILDLKREPTNANDALAVCIEIDGGVVGHMPCNLAPLV